MSLAATTLPAQAGAAAFVDANDYFVAEPGFSGLSLRGYYDALDSLKAQFDLICGDTFCEGEFSNLSSLGLDCSVNTATHRVGQCVWTFAGSYADVNPRNGRVSMTRHVQVCQLGFEGTSAELAAFLRAAGEPGYGNQGLRDVAIPGRFDGKALMDVLGDCL